MRPRPVRRLLCAACIACGLAAAACGELLKPDYEYEEQLDVALDGSATLTLSASVAALVALRGADLDPDPRARLDRERLRAMFEGPGAEVVRLTLSRRRGRRFVHVSLDVDDVRQLPQIAPFAWSTYRFDRRADIVEFRQIVGGSEAKAVGQVGWRGDELVAFRVRAPSRIPFHNAPGGIRRGNVLEWSQPLTERLQGTPLDLQAQMELESILSSTLLLFGSTILAAAAAFAAVLWWVMRAPVRR